MHASNWRIPHRIKPAPRTPRIAPAHAAALLILLVLPMSGALRAESEKISNIEQKLNRLVERLKSLGGQQADQKAELQRGEQQLIDIDRRISDTVGRMRALSRQMQQKEAEIKRLEQEQLRHREDIQRHKELLARHLSALFQAGQHVRLHGLLEPQKLAQFLRTQKHLKYLQDSREQQVGRLLQQIGAIEALTREIQDHTRELDRQRAEYQAQQLELDRQKREQAKSVASLRQDLTETQREIAQVSADRRSLNDLLDRLRDEAQQRQAKGAGEAFDGDSPFAKYKGKLPWPVKGKLIQYATGVKIVTDEGVNVQSIGEGKVIFADWMRGLGLLVIVSHGSGYLSLYGHNEAIFVKPGQSIGAGTVIGTTGRSGGQAQPGVYFELRKETKPLDPFAWCARG